MKILHIAATTLGGACTAAVRIHQGLLDAGINSHFLTLENPKQGLKNIHVISHFFNLAERFLLKTGLLKSYEREVLKLMKSINFNAEAISLPFADIDITKHPQYSDADIIHLHWVSGILDYGKFFKKNKKPVVWTLHDMQPFMGIFHYSLDLNKNKSLEEKENEIIHLKQKLLNKKDITVHATSGWMLQRSVSSLIFKNARHRLIPLMVDTSLFKPVDKNSAKEFFSLPENKTCIGFISTKNTNKRKGLDILLKSLKNISQENIHIFCVGDAEKIPGVHSLGQIENDETLNLAYNAADVIIIPSIEEAFSLVFIEAISCGVPVIAFNAGAMADHIVRGNLGIIADNISEQGLSDAITKFIDTKDSFIKEDIRNYATANFETSVVSKLYIDLYNDINETKN